MLVCERLSPPEVLCCCVRGDFLPRRCCAGVCEKTFSPGGVVLVCVMRLFPP